MTIIETPGRGPREPEAAAGGAPMGGRSVPVKEITPPENNTRWNISFQSAKSGAGEQFLLLDCRARACQKECLSNPSPISAFGEKSPHLRLLRVSKLSLSNPTSSNTTSLNSEWCQRE